MTTSSVDFASLLCARLCHDLLSPVGALNNGLELLADETDPEMRARCMELLAESARVSANKLKFFRLAFGATGGFDDPVETREAQTAIVGLFGGGKPLEIGWLIEDERLPKPAIKALLNLAMIAGDALVRGGRLDIGAERRDDLIEIVLRAEGPRIACDEPIRATLTDGAAAGATTQRTAAARLVHMIVTEARGTVRVESDEATLLIGATLRAA